MIRVAFVIGGYPPEEYKRRADVARSYSTSEIEVGIIDTKASPYFYGITPTEIQLVTPAYIESYRQAKKEGYDAVVPLGMLDLGVDGGNRLSTFQSLDRWSRLYTSPRCLATDSVSSSITKNCSHLTAPSSGATAWKTESSGSASAGLICRILRINETR